MSTSSTQILKDTADALIIKLTREQSDSTQETHAEKVNAAALVATTFNLAFDGVLTGVGPNGLVPGETLTGNTSGATAKLVHYQPEANNLYVVNVSGSFANSEVVIGSLTRNRVTLGSSNPQSASGRSLDLESLWYSISEGARVTVEWEGADNAAAAAYATIADLSENGYFGKNALAGLFKAPANSNTFTSNGSISVTTLGLTANGGYTIVLELRKGNGYSPVPDERN